MNNIMKYKGYRASASYSEEDGCFIGKVLGIGDTLIFDGDTVSELKQMFHESIDDYLEMCRETGKQPDREYRGTFNVRVTPQAHGAAVRRAEEMGISLNQFVAEAIQEKLDRAPARYEITKPQTVGVAESAAKYGDPESDLQVLAKAEHVLAEYIEKMTKER